jgi:hypothetical protein
MSNPITTSTTSCDDKYYNSRKQYSYTYHSNTDSTKTVTPYTLNDSGSDDDMPGLEIAL